MTDEKKHRFKSLPSKAIVREVGSDNIIDVHRFDFNNPEKREWLKKLMVWALYNKHKVEVVSAADDDAEQALENEILPVLAG